MTEQMISPRFRKWARAYFNDEVTEELIDEHYCPELTIDDNVQLFKERFGKTLPVAEPTQVVHYRHSATETATKSATLDLDTVDVVAIMGDKHTGKSNLMFYHMNNYAGKRTKYLFGYPEKVDGYRTLSTIGDLATVKDAIVGIDEIQKQFRVYDRRANIELQELISLAKHNRLTLLFTTTQSQFITRGLEGTVDVWNITRIKDLGALKNGSKPKRVIQNLRVPQATQWSLSLANGQFVQYGEALTPEMNGVHEFENQNVGKVWGAR